MISLQEVEKRYASAPAPAVSGLTLDVAEGDTVALVGPSGCGKTTTVKMINRLIEPTGGRILLAGANVLERDPVELRRGIGYVIQQTGLLPHRTVRDNIVTVPRLLGWERDRTDARVEEMVEIFDLAPDLLARYPAELSGGQRQRVGVARALAADPPVMLMDEPFAAVDPIVRGRLQDQFLDIQRRLRKTIVLVTHDVDEAIKLADRVAVLNVGGVLEQYAPPEEILRAPASAFVEEFVGADRGLKRLGLIPVGTIETEPGPTVSSSSDASEALAVIAAGNLGWANVVDEGMLRGWVDEASLTDRRRVADATIRPLSSTVAADDSLRQALNAIVTSETGVAVVVRSDGSYIGILTLERLSRELAA